MGSLGKFISSPFRGVKSLITDPGRWAKNFGKSAIQAAPYVAGASMLLPGIGTAIGGTLGAGLAGAGKLAGKASGAYGGLGGGGGSGGMPSTGGFGGGGGFGDIIRQLSGSGGPGGGSGPAPSSGGGSGLGDLIGGLGGLIGKGVRTIKDRPEYLLAGANAVYGADRARKAEGLRKDAIGAVKGSYDAREPLRERGIEGMMNRKRPSLEASFADPTNPFSRKAPDGQMGRDQPEEPRGRLLPPGGPRGFEDGPRGIFGQLGPMSPVEPGLTDKLGDMPAFLREAIMRARAAKAGGAPGAGNARYT